MPFVITVHAEFALAVLVFYMDLRQPGSFSEAMSLCAALHYFQPRSWRAALRPNPIHLSDC